MKKSTEKRSWGRIGCLAAKKKPPLGVRREKRAEADTCQNGGAVVGVHPQQNAGSVGDLAQNLQKNVWVGWPRDRVWYRCKVKVTIL